MKKLNRRILSVLLAAVLFLTNFPVITFAEDDFAITCAGERVTKVSFAENEKLTVSADNLPAGCTYQWQIHIPGTEQWVNIQGKTEQTLGLTYAVLGSLLDDTNSAQVRCAAVQNGEQIDHTKALRVQLTDAVITEPEVCETEAIAPDPLPAPSAVGTDADILVKTDCAENENASTEAITEETEIIQPHTPMLSSSDPLDETTIYTITIEYIYGESSEYSGQRVALDHVEEVPEGDTAKNDKVVSPVCVGYSPDIAEIDLGALGAIDTDYTFTVKYAPAEVSYTVRHYQQNVDDDDYVWVDTTVVTAHTESLTTDEDAAKSYTGFEALEHYHEKVAADSSTMIDIYYDRIYYLMSFDLGGGYGVEAIYARYGAAISGGTPERAGYTFADWDRLTTDSDDDGKPDTGDGVKDALPATMPAEQTYYGALWDPVESGTSYYITYWLEDADEEGTYVFAGSAQITADAGVSISGEDNAVDKGVFAEEDAKYYTFNEEKTDKDVTVAGDNSTVVNVYYDRNAYTLKFYYARSSYSYWGTTYYQVATDTGGSSNNGGTVADASWGEDSTTAVVLLDDYVTKPGVTTGSEPIDSNTYYYFTLTAKYGADLTNIWPNAPLSPHNDYKFISWGTHYGSGYYNKEDNKNIKGVYNVMDSGLLIDPTVTSDQGVNHWMVAYWNTSPTMYQYEIYYSLLEGETKDREYEGEGYRKINTYTVGSTAGPSGQSPLSFDGVQYIGKDDDKNITVYFYYKRNAHTITFDDGYGFTTAEYTISYGETINKIISALPEPDYPDQLPEGAYEFAGWYTAQGGAGDAFTLEDAGTMPDGDLTYYAKWEPVTYEIIINNGDGLQLGTQNVGYGGTATAPTDPTMDDAEFIGWYYTVNGVEYRFDFATMKIESNMTIYAKWRSTKMKQVVISYLAEIDGETVQVADSESLMLRVGQIRTFDAKTGSALYLEYQTGCFPTVASHSITPTEDDLEEEGALTYNFEYKKYGKVPYQVEYYVSENGVERPAFKNVDGKAEFMETYVDTATPYVEQHWENDKAVVVELYVPDNLSDATWVLPDEYLPDYLKQQKIIIPAEENPESNIEANVIEFVYTLQEDVDPGTGGGGNLVYSALYLVQHFVQSGSEYVLNKWITGAGYSGTVVSASPLTFAGYTYNAAVTEEQMNAFNDGRTTLNTLDDTKSTMTGTITADDSLELNFYYTVNSYPYQVLYLEQGTNRVLATAKTTDGSGNKLTAAYNSKVTETAIDIAGYDVVTDDCVVDSEGAKKSIYIHMEAGDEASVNTIVFYYVEQNADLVITKTVKMDEEQAAHEGFVGMPDSVKEQEFDFTVKAKNGFLYSVYDYTLYNGDDVASTGKVTTADTYTLNPISIKGGQKVAIHDLALGEYTVTETNVVGFLTTVDDTIATSATVTLDASDGTTQVDFVNTFPFYTGDLVVLKEVYDGSTEITLDHTYKVKITLYPAAETRELARVITWTNGDGTDCSFTVPTLADDARTSFEITVDVPAGGEVKLEGAPAGTFIMEEIPNEGSSSIDDYYTVKHKVVVHPSDDLSIMTGPSVTSSEIHGGHPTAVNFYNIYKKGTLVINKTVTQEYEKDSWESDTFTFSISGTTELPDGSYTVTVDGTDETVTVSNGKLAFTKTISVEKPSDSTDTAWTEQLTIENLPAGYYTVKEESSVGGLSQYTTTNPEENLLVHDTAATNFDFTNTFIRTTGNLQVGKEIRIVTEGSVIDEQQEFTFEVSAKEGTTLDGSYECEVKTTNGTADTSDDTVVSDSVTALTASDNKLTFVLKHNQYILIKKLPVGDYLVREYALEGYDSSFGDVSDGSQYSVDPATIKTDETITLNCQNAYPVYYSNLVVIKKVEDAIGNSSLDTAPDDDKFTFEIVISDYSTKVDLSKGVTAKYYDKDDTLTDTETLYLTDNKLTFSLQKGQKVNLNLPACNYTITETAMVSIKNTTGSLEDHYDISCLLGEQNGAKSMSSVLTSGETESITFTNVYKQHFSTLTITQEGVNATDSGIYEVVDSSSQVIATVMITGNASVTLEQIPVDTYTIREVSYTKDANSFDWTWTYQSTLSRTVTVQANATNEVTFNHTPISLIDWLHSENHK